MRFSLPLLLLWVVPLAAQQPVTLSSATFGQMEARNIGPAVMGGRITAIEGVHSTPQILYVGTAGGGVWKSRTGGLSFEPVFDKHPQSIGAIAIDQARPDTVWVGTGESNMRNSVSIGQGIYRSTDAGRNWTRMGLEYSEHIAKIILHPSDPNTLYVAVPGSLWSDSAERGLYKTVDGGKTWVKILYVDPKTGCADIIMDPRNPDVLFAAMWQFRRTPYSFTSGGPGSALYRSADGGKTWTKVTNGLPSGEFGRIALALAPSAPDNMLAIVESENTGLYISNDAGANWKLQSATSNVTARPFYFSTLVVDPQNPKRVYRPAFTLSISNDGGYSFSEAGNDGGWVHSDHHALWIDPSDNKHMYLGTDGGVYMSLDQGLTWTHLNSLPVSQFYHVQTDEQTPYYVYGGLQDNGSWRAPSSSPGGVENGDWTPISGGDGFWVQPETGNPDVVYSESQGGNIARQNLRTNQGQGIQPQALASDPELRWNWNTPIVKSPTDPKTLYIGAQFLFKTTDGGYSWTKISPDLSTNDTLKQRQYASGGLTVDNSSAENHCTIFAIAPSPIDPNLIYVGTDDGNIQCTRDGGKTWSKCPINVTSLPPGAWVSSIEPSRFKAGTVYATFDHHMYGDMSTYAAVSSDYGQNWSRISNSKPLKGYAHIIREDLQSPNLLFMGTEFGLYISNDFGVNWVNYKAGLPEYLAVRDIAIEPRTNDLVLATHGRGVYIIDNIAPLRKLTPELLQKPAALLATRPTAVSTGHFGSGFPNTDAYTGPNAPEQVLLYYYLKDRVSDGDVNIEIRNAAGELLFTLPGSKRKGINIVRWDMRLKAPKMASGAMVMGEQGMAARFIGPLAQPGAYHVRLIAPGVTDESALELVPDPLLQASVYPERKKISSELFQMVEEHALLTEQVKNLRDSIDQTLPKVKGKSTRAQMQQLSAGLDALFTSLTETNTSAGITGEKKLRAEIGRLYVEVESSDLLPTQSSRLRKEALKTQLAGARAQADGYFAALPGINKALAKEQIRPLRILDQAGFDKQYSAAPSGGDARKMEQEMEE